jgi:acetyl-CoA carboxylase carboxyltransferase component
MHSRISGTSHLIPVQVHSLLRLSGVSDQLASDEFDAAVKAREWMASLNWEPAQLPATTQCAIMEPIYDPRSSPLLPLSDCPDASWTEEILNIASADVRQPWEVRELIGRIVDGSRFVEFKPLYGPGLVCGWAYIHGFPIGIIANNNVLFPPEANKATQFIRLCNTRDAPIVFLQNSQSLSLLTSSFTDEWVAVTGFMVGKKYEEAGIIKAGSHFIVRRPHASTLSPILNSRFYRTPFPTRPSPT